MKDDGELLVLGILGIDDDDDGDGVVLVGNTGDEELERGPPNTESPDTRRFESKDGKEDKDDDVEGLRLFIVSFTSTPSGPFLETCSVCLLLSARRGVIPVLQL